MKVFTIVLLSFTVCVTGEFEGFIVGGTKVRSILDYPHVAFLVVTDVKSDQYICGSSILNQWILLTAAHCISSVTTASASVGSVHVHLGVQHTVDKYKIHSKWHAPTVSHDVGVFKVRKPIHFGSSVKRAIMMKNPPKAKVAVVTGWGAVDEMTYTNSDLLKQTTQTLWDHDRCKTVLNRGLPAGTICGGQTKSTSFASKGDSGSGLMVNKKIIIGLVSYKDTRISDSLVVYTDVSHYYDWIKRTAEMLVGPCSEEY